MPPLFLGQSVTVHSVFLEQDTVLSSKEKPMKILKITFIYFLSQSHLQSNRRENTNLPLQYY